MKTRSELIEKAAAKVGKRAFELATDVEVEYMPSVNVLSHFGYLVVKFYNFEGNRRNWIATAKLRVNAFETDIVEFQSSPVTCKIGVYIKGE